MKIDFDKTRPPQPELFDPQKVDATKQNAEMMKKLKSAETRKTALKIREIALSIFGWAVLGLLIFFATNYLGWNHFVCPVPMDNFPAAFVASFAVITFATTYYTELR